MLPIKPVEALYATAKNPCTDEEKGILLGVLGLTPLGKHDGELSFNHKPSLYGGKTIPSLSSSCCDSSLLSTQEREGVE